MNLQICFMNEESETIEIDGSTTGGDADFAHADDHAHAAPRHFRQSAPALHDHDLDSTLTPSATLVAQKQAALEDGVPSGVPSAAASESSGAANSLMKNSKSVGHFLHCLLPGEQ